MNGLHEKDGAYSPEKEGSLSEKEDVAPVEHNAFANIDEKRVLRKMDLRLIPMLSLLYLLSFLDRTNIGNAKIAGMDRDLGLVGNQYNLCATVFFFTYCAFEIPSNLVLKRLRPSVWLPGIMVAWGTVMTLMGLVRDYHGLLIARIFLGVAEAGLYPGVAFYLTHWYPRQDLGFRQGLFFSAASVAGAFSGLLAFAIAKMDGVGNLAGWRWIFILEGILTVIVAVFAYFAMYDWPSTAAFLTEEEKAWVLHRLQYQGSKASGRSVAENDAFKWKYVWKALADFKIYIGVLQYWGIVVPLYSLGYFLPQILNQLGYQAETAQLLTVPIYIVAAALAVIVSFYSDRAVKRGASRWPYIFAPMCAILIGFIMAISGSASGKAGLVYAGVFVGVAGIYPSFPLNISLIGSNLSPSSKRAAGMALHISLGNMAGAIGSNIYRGQDAPKYLLGHGLNIGFTVIGLCACLTLRLVYGGLNKKRDRMGDASHLTDEELADLGDDAPSYRYSP